MRHIWVSTVLVAACAGLPEPDEDVGEVSAAGIAQNGIAQNGIAQNGLTANPTVADALLSMPLTVGWKDPRINSTIGDPRAVVMFDYLWQCAAPAGARLTFADLRPSPTYPPVTFVGQLGLCPQWVNGLPDKECLEQVSACLAVRTNAFPIATTPGRGIRVLLSLRSENFTFPDLWKGPATEVAPIDSYEMHNDQIASVKRCTSKQVGYTRDCGWAVDRIGTCVPGTSAIVSTYDYGGRTNGPSALRICDGVHACDNAPPLATYPAAKKPVSVMHSPVGGADQVSFTCPPTGRFSVMVGPYASTDNLTIITGAKLKNGKFPAPEGWTAADRAVFTWPEGHFFGNMFGSANLSANPSPPTCDTKTYKCTTGGPAVGESTYSHMYACSSEVWRDGDAYLRQRLCAGQRQNCPAIPVGPCARVCRFRDGPQRPGDNNFQDCIGPDRNRYESGITSYLDDPCTLTGASPACITSCGPDPASCM